MQKIRKRHKFKVGVHPSIAGGIAKSPLILETPKERDDDDKRNLKKVFNILSNVHP